MSNWRTYFKKGLLILFLSFLLYALVGLLFLFLSPLGRPVALQSLDQLFPNQTFPDEVQTADAWADSMLKSSPPITRTLTISATAERLTFDFALWISPTQSLYAPIYRGDLEASNRRAAFVKAAFGEIRVNGSTLTETLFSAPIWTVDSNSRMMQVHLTAASIRDQTQSRDYWIGIYRSNLALTTAIPMQDLIYLKFNGVRFSESSIPPSEKNDTTATIVLNQSGAPEPIYLALNVFSTAQASPSAPPSEPARESRQSFISRLGDIIPDGVVARLLFAVVEVLPLLIFCWLTIRQGQNAPPFALALVGSVASLLLFHFALYFLQGSFYQTGDKSLFQDFADWTSRSFRLYNTAYLLTSAPVRAAPVILGIILPVWLSQTAGWSSPRAHRLGARILRLLSVLLALAPVGLVTYLIVSDTSIFPIDPGEFPLYVWMLFAASLLTFLIWLTLRLLYRQITDLPLRPGVIWLATLLTVLNATLDPLYDWRQWTSLLWFILSVGMGVALLMSFGRIGLALVKTANPQFSLSAGWRAALLLVGVGTVIPLWSLVGSNTQIAYDTDILNLAYRLDDWIPFIWLSGVLWLLYQGGKNGQVIDSFTRMVGIVGIGAFLFSPLDRWFYIPITFLIGLFMLSRFIRPAEYWKELEPFFSRVFDGRLDLLDKIIDLNVAESSYKQLRKKLGGKLAAGDDKLTFADYDKQLEERKAELDSLNEKAKIENKPVKEVALTFGPFATAWANAIHGTKLALLFALPWLLIYLREFLTSSNPRSPYLLWGFAYELILILIKWGIFGFCFGYFYPYLRGRNGLQKGLGLFLVAVLPTLLLMIVYTTTPEAWQARLFWVSQVFIQCMLLGLVAFDYQTLRQGYYDWQMLFEVHGMTGVGVSVSSIIVAVGAVSTTLIASGATTLVSTALGYFIPQVSTFLPMPPTPTPIPRVGP